MRWRELFGRLVVLVLVGACTTNKSGAPKQCPPGAETCACYGNRTCDTGLACLSGLCVRATDTGGAGGTANGGAGGAAGSGGTPVGGPDAAAGGASGAGGTGTGGSGTGGSADGPGAGGAAGGGAGGTGTGGAGGSGTGGAGGGALACAVGSGQDGLISDFTNQAIGAARDGRTAIGWQIYNSGPDSLLSVITDGGSYYLHAKIDWLSGSCGVPLTADCYDASAYSGLRVNVRSAQAFATKARIAIRARGTVPVVEGGSCALADPVRCYDAFYVDFDAGTTWTTLSFPWSAFHQTAGTNRLPGYQFQREIMSILFAPQVGFPLDLHLDDLTLY